MLISTVWIAIFHDRYIFARTMINRYTPISLPTAKKKRKKKSVVTSQVFHK